MIHRPSRRGFLQSVALATGAVLAGPYIVRAQNLNRERLRFAFIGTGGQGNSHLYLADPDHPLGGVCTAYCDVDTGPRARARISTLAPNAPSYTDFRQMLEKHEKEIDAVVVAIPDHSHAAASMMAMKMGKHVYCEKPLTWSIHEARVMAEAARKYRVATQMGNGGHANEGNRIVVEYIRSGVLGDITEIHTWTNRPVWPQSITRRPPAKPVPPNLDWDCWIGPAPYREYHDGLHSFDWRGWFDFGCGDVGDMGCHTWDCVFWAMEPDYPSSVELVRIVDRCEETFPRQSIIKWTFPAKRSGRHDGAVRPGFEAYWYSGGLKPPVPEEIMNDPTRQPPPPTTQPAERQGARRGGGQQRDPRQLSASGSLFIGTKGKLYVQGDYGDSPRLIPESFHQQVGRPPRLLARSVGHMQEWVRACKAERPYDSAGSNFTHYAAPITEVMHLGAIAVRIGEVGFKIECDPENRTIKTPEAQKYYHREYRKGWTL